MMHGQELMEWNPLIEGLGWVVMFMIWVVAITGFVHILHRFLSWRNNRSRQTPLDILKFRYAQGEISDEEYNRMKKELK